MPGEGEKSAREIMRFSHSNLDSLSICQKQPTSFAKLIIHEQTTAVELYARVAQSAKSLL
jgi:hypothetical protein